MNGEYLPATLVALAFGWLAQAGCSGGSELDCRPDALVVCAEGAVYWVDSCGYLGDLRETCPCGCAAERATCGECPCVPACEGRTCGPDECGDECGPGCASNEICQTDGTCLCVPECEGKECGPDGCGRECGEGCGAGLYCSEDSRCELELEPEWALIPAGTFTMGPKIPDSLGYSNPHVVTLTRDFWMRTTEVTQVEFLHLMGFTTTAFPDCGPTCPIDSVYFEATQFYCNKMSEEENLPFCYYCVQVDGRIGCHLDERWATPYDCPGYRLPTEAEWEYAARAGNPNETYAVDCEEPCESAWWETLDAIAWYDDNSGDTPHPVSFKEPNAFGLYDMLGNVVEWVEDGNRNYPTEHVIDPFVPLSWDSCLFRGAGFNWGADFTTVYHRDGFSCGMTGYFQGFRIVRTAAE